MTNINILISDSQLAFLNQQNETALELANQAIALDGKSADAYKCAANALMSLARYDEAIKNYRLALKYDPANGNRYFDLGFALATNDKLADALKYLAKADELGCATESVIQLYNLLGIICFDLGRFEDALVNLEKAEQLAGVNLDILRRKAIIHGIRNEIRKGLEVTNQIKLVAPSEYMGYQLAFQLLVQTKRLGTAAAELEKAARFAKPTMDRFYDQMSLELELYNGDNDKAHFLRALEIIREALKVVKPDFSNTVDCYINAAEIYLQLEDGDKTLECLSAALAPVAAYNNGFDILGEPVEMPAEIDDYGIEAMLEEEQEKLVSEHSDYELEELFESTEPDDDGEFEFFTELDEEEEQAPAAGFVLEAAEGEELTAEQRDQINRLYMGAYIVNKDYEQAIKYARILQAGEGIQNTHIGKYTEAQIYKMMGSEETSAKYAEAIKFFRNCMIKDPTDLMAANFRIRCCIDIGDYVEAERLCSLLAEEARKPLLDEIRKAKSGGV